MTFKSILLIQVTSFSLLSQNSLNDPGSTYVFNHVQFLIWYHQENQNDKDERIVKASIAVASCDTIPCTIGGKGKKINVGKEKTGKLTIDYSYSVLFIVRFVVHPSIHPSIILSIHSMTIHPSIHQ